MSNSILYSSPDKCPALPARDTTVFDHLLPAQSVHDPRTPAFIDGITGRILTRAQLRNDAIRLSHGVDKLKRKAQDLYPPRNGKPVDPVALLFSPNSVDYPLIFMGIQAAHCITSLANASYLTDELAHQIRDSLPFVIFVHPSLAPVLESALVILKEEGLPVKDIAIYSACPPLDQNDQNAVPLFPTYHTLFVDGKPVPPPGAPSQSTSAPGSIEDATAILCYSSGTVRHPRVVLCMCQKKKGMLTPFMPIFADWKVQGCHDHSQERQSCCFIVCHPIPRRPQGRCLHGSLALFP